MLPSHIDRKIIICHAYLLSLEEDHVIRLAAIAHAREEYQFYDCGRLLPYLSASSYGVDDDADQK